MKHCAPPNFSALLLLALLPLWPLAQNPPSAPNPYALTDSIALTFKKSGHKTPESLAKAMCQGLASPRDKARAIYTWLAHNIRYDLDGMDRGPLRGTLEELEKMHEKMTLDAYKKGKGICQDYSDLYKKMADAVGLECEVVTGHSRASYRRGWERHAWNAVRLDSAWQLLDATWGAGYVDDDDDRFRQAFSTGFFCAPPQLLALNHFPEDEQWQMLEAPISKKEFKRQPYVDYSGRDWLITDATPLDAPLRRDAEGKVEIRLKMQRPPKVIGLRMSDKLVPVEPSQKDGWTVLRFPVGSLSSVMLYGGERRGGKLRLMGAFSVK